MAVVRQKNVLRLQVAVDDIKAMQVLQRECDFGGVPATQRVRKGRGENERRVATKRGRARAVCTCAGVRVVRRERVVTYRRARSSENFPSFPR